MEQNNFTSTLKASEMDHEQRRIYEKFSIKIGQGFKVNKNETLKVEQDQDKKQKKVKHPNEIVIN